jgi:hypothetical protein
MTSIIVALLSILVFVKFSFIRKVVFLIQIEIAALGKVS